MRETPPWRWRRRRYAEAQKTLDSLKNPTELDIALAQGQVSDAQEALDTLKNPTAVDIALAEAQVNEAQEALDTLKNPTAVDIELAKQQVANAQEYTRYAQERRLRGRHHRSEKPCNPGGSHPGSGAADRAIRRHGDECGYAAWRYQFPGTTAFRIDDLSNLYIDLSISEVDIAQIQVGQKVTLAFDAISDKEYTGIVSKVVMVGTVSQGVVNYPVTVQITDGDTTVLSGMTASVEIITAESANVLVVPNKAIRTIRQPTHCDRAVRRTADPGAGDGWPGRRFVYGNHRHDAEGRRCGGCDHNHGYN